MYGNVLIPTDGSEGASRGAKHALDIADKYGATVHVLYVVDERIHGGTPALGADELAFEKWEQAGEDAIGQIVEEARDQYGLETKSVCVRGTPFEVILDYADENDIDLIVMGLHGTSGIRRPHIGSTTDRVLRESPVPVLPV